MDIFKLVGSVFVDTDKANDSLSKTDKKASSVGSTLLKGVGTAGKFAVGLTTACAAGATALVGMATKAASTTDNIDKMSQKIGISRQAYQELDFICSQSGASVDNLKAGMKTLTNQMQAASEGSEKATAAFDTLGLSWTDGTGKIKDQETMMWEAFSALQSMEDQTMKAALASDLFGKAGTELMPMLNGATGSIEAMKQQAHDLGLVLEDDAVDAGVKLTDTMDQTKRAFDAIVTKIGVNVMPIVQKALEFVLDKMPMIQGAFEKFSPIAMGLLESLIPPLFELVQTLFPVLLSLLETLLPPAIQIVETIIPVFVQLLNTLLPPLMEIIQMLLPILVQLLPPILSLLQPIINLLNPIIQLAMALLTPLLQLLDVILPPLIQIITLFINVALIRLQTTFQVLADVISNVINVAVSYVKDQIALLKNIFVNIIDFFKNVFTGDWSAAFENIKNIIGNVFEMMVNKVKTPVNVIIGIINGLISGVTSGVNKVIDILNKLEIDVPDWVTEKIGIKDFGFNIKKIEAYQIPLLAKGGKAVKEGSAIVGEAGAELINLPAGAQVTPLTNNENVLRSDEIVSLLLKILQEAETMNNEFYDRIVDALCDAVKMKWNGREIARMVKEYA